MKISLLILTTIFFFGIHFSQTEKKGFPAGYSSKIELPKSGIKLPMIDNLYEFNYHQDLLKNSGEKVGQYGKAIELNVDFFTEAKQTLLNDKTIYHLVIESANAKSLNVIFFDFRLETGTLLYLFAIDKSSFDGAYTSLNNNGENQLGSDLIYSEKIVIEIQEPIANKNKSRLTIGSAIHGFINLDNYFDKALNQSGDCNIDVNCPEGSSWKLPRNSVAMLVNANGGFCSGAMVNNTSGVLIPYFLTANHCGQNPAAWVFRFRWESPEDSSDCGTSAFSGMGPETMNINGGVTRANYAPSDFHLIELNTLPPPSWEVIYNGWDRSENPASSGAGIHHPSGDIKKISISETPFESFQLSVSDETHWKVQWSEGVTEGGSSGSPVFNQFRRIVGQLQGGSSGCGSSDQSDLYGKFYYSWNGGGTDQTRLSNWLDPQGLDLPFINGNVSNVLDPFFENKVLNLANTSCSPQIDPKVVLFNGGTTVLTAATIRYTIDGQNPINLAWSGSLGLFEVDTISIPTVNLPQGAHTILIEVLNPNNQIDENLTNNIASSSFYVVVDGFNFQFSLNLDCYANETSWEIVNNENTVLYSSPNYTALPLGYTVTTDFCLYESCFDFKIYDKWGDGFSSSDCLPGSYFILDSNNDTVISLNESQANFGSVKIENFCVGSSNLQEMQVSQEQIKVFPNPFQNKIYIESKNQIVGVAIFDLFGRKVDEYQNIDKNSFELKTSLNTGSYFMQIQTIDAITLTKLTKI